METEQKFMPEKLDAAEFGVEKTEAKQINTAFVPMITTLKDMEDTYNAIVRNPEVTDTLVQEARTLRLRFVKLRTAADDVHKKGKAKILRASQAWDALRKIMKHAISDKEEVLFALEKHKEIKERERKEKLAEEREALLEQYEANTEHIQLGEMEPNVWDNYFTGVKAAYEQRVAAEKKALADVIAEEKKKDAERKRIKQENEKLKREAEKKEKELEAINEKARKEHLARQKQEAEEAKKREEEAATLKAKQEAQLDKEREEREKVEAELKAKREEEEKVQAEKDEQEKQARLATDKVKLMALADLIDRINMPALQNPESAQIITNIKTLLAKTTAYLRDKSNSI